MWEFLKKLICYSTIYASDGRILRARLQLIFSGYTPSKMDFQLALFPPESPSYAVTEK
jgi:hypothetical protein